MCAPRKGPRRWWARTSCSPLAGSRIPPTSASTRRASRPIRADISWSTISWRTNVPGIWAIGDVNGRGAFTHTSYNDYEIVAANLFDGDARRISDRLTAYALYIDPPLGRVGMTEREARQSGRKVLIGKRMMTRVGRPRANAARPKVS